MAAKNSKGLVWLILTSVELCGSSSAFWSPIPFNTLPAGVTLLDLQPHLLFAVSGTWYLWKVFPQLSFNLTVTFCEKYSLIILLLHVFSGFQTLSLVRIIMLRCFMYLFLWVSVSPKRKEGRMESFSVLFCVVCKCVCIHIFVSLQQVYGGQSSTFGVLRCNPPWFLETKFFTETWGLTN